MPRASLAPETLDGLLRGFSHDARNPLLVLEGSLDIAAHRGADDLPALLDRLRWVHADLCARLDAFTDSVRAVLAPRPPRLTRVRLAPLCDGLAQRLGPLFAMAQVRLDLPAAPPGAIHTDASQLSRILANLAVRALRRAAPGDAWGLRLTSRGEGIRFEVDQPPFDAADVPTLLERRELELAAALVLADDLGIAFTPGPTYVTLDVPTEAHD